MNCLSFKFRHGPPLEKADKEISYAGLKAILMHMEANKRFQLAAQIPCIRYAEKGTPLKLTFLRIASTRLDINEMAYNLGVIRVGTHLPHYQRINDEGGEEYDLDQFGDTDHLVDSIMTPGDILFQEDEEIEFNVEEEQEFLEELKALPDQTESEKLEIEKIEARIYTWQLRQENKPAPYKMQLQYSTWRDEGGKKLEIKKWNYNYSQKVHEAMKCLTEKLLGNRLQTINVRRLRVHPHGVLRLPEDLFIKVRCLITSGDVAQLANSLKSLIHRNSFPLELLTLLADSEFEEVENHEHEWVTSSDRLVLRKNPYNPDSWAHLVMKTLNRQVAFYHGRLTLVEINGLVDKIIEKLRSIGTTYSFDEWDWSVVKNLMDSLKQRPDAISYKHGKLIPPCPFDVVLPMPGASRLLIYCQENPRFDVKTYKDSGFAPWLIVMTVKRENKCRRAVKPLRVMERKVADFIWKMLLALKVL